MTKTNVKQTDPAAQLEAEAERATEAHANSPAGKAEARAESFAHAIDKGLPIPRTRGVSAHPYPFHQMEPGDSFLVERGEKTVNISNIKQAAEKRVPNSKWTTRKVDGGFRIWRVS